MDDSCSCCSSNAYLFLQTTAFLPKSSAYILPTCVNIIEEPTPAVSNRYLMRKALRSRSSWSGDLDVIQFDLFQPRLIILLSVLDVCWPGSVDSWIQWMNDLRGGRIRVFPDFMPFQIEQFVDVFERTAWSFRDLEGKNYSARHIAGHISDEKELSKIPINRFSVTGRFLSFTYHYESIDPCYSATTREESKSPPASHARYQRWRRLCDSKVE